MKKTILWLRAIADAAHEARYVPLILIIFVALIWLLPSYQSPPQQKMVTITLPVEQMDVVMKGLVKLPYEESAAVIEAIQAQAWPQLYPPQKADTTKPKKQ